MVLDLSHSSLLLPIPGIRSGLLGLIFLLVGVVGSIVEFEVGGHLQSQHRLHFCFGHICEFGFSIDGCALFNFVQIFYFSKVFQINFESIELDGEAGIILPVFPLIVFKLVVSVQQHEARTDLDGEQKNHQINISLGHHIDIKSYIITYVL